MHGIRHRPGEATGDAQHASEHAALIVPKIEHQGAGAVERRAQLVIRLASEPVQTDQASTGAQVCGSLDRALGARPANLIAGRVVHALQDGAGGRASEEWREAGIDAERCCACQLGRRRASGQPWHEREQREPLQGWPEPGPKPWWQDGSARQLSDSS